ncbi:MAG: immunoglobulin domain-containing protein [Verrucomicrobiota bacterium]
MWGSAFSRIAVCTFLHAHSICAGLLFTDDFSYPDGPLVTVSNGRWRTHSGTTAQAAVVAGELQLAQSHSEDVSTVLAAGPLSATNATALYAAFTARFMVPPTGAAGGYFAHFKDATPTMGLRCRVFVTTNGAAPDTVRVGIAAGTNSASAVWGQALKLNSPYRLVCRLVLSNNLSTLWINPRSERDTSITSTDEVTVKSVSAFALRQSLASGNGMGSLAIDNLSVATSFAETFQNIPPSILNHPKAQTAPAGTDVRFTVDVVGTEPLFFQWLLNGIELAGATASMLTLPHVRDSDAGEYQVWVSNSAGSATSEPATLTVQPTLPVLQIWWDQDIGVRLAWPAEPEHSYSVWAGDAALATWSLIQSELAFWDGSGWFEETLPTNPIRFYRISSP